MKRPLVFLTVLAAACGGGERSAQPPAAPPAPPAAPASPQAAAPPAADTAVSATASAGGQAVYARTCQTCHQANGRGMPNTFPPIAGSEIINGDKRKLIRLVLHGLQGPITVAGQRFNNVMPPWKVLSDAEMAAVLTYERSHFGNSSSAVTAEEVARERAATSSRATMWTMTELEASLR